jgi:hypothetical protein
MTWLLLFFAALLAACGGTEKTRRTFPLSVEARTSPLVTDSGWTVTLSEAKASLSTVRFFSGKVLITRRSIPMDWLISSAWAHPGHYAPGEALGELLTPVEVDLLSASATPWGTASAVTGEYGSLQLGFGTAGLSLKGTASKDGVTVAFATTFTPPAPLEGVKFEQTMTTEAGAAVILFDLNVILSRVDFSQVGAGASPLDSASPAFNGFARGVEDTSAYIATWRN